jgi:hypothetical protein
MNIKVSPAPRLRQSAPDDRPDSDESASADLSLWLERLRRALSDTEWTPEALDAHWKTSRGYAWRLVNGEKPWSLERKLSLPLDVRRRLARLEAESHGLYVVEPSRGPEAPLAFIAGFLGLLMNQQLPARAEQMAHAAIERRASERRSA